MIMAVQYAQSRFPAVSHPWTMPGFAEPGGGIDGGQMTEPEEEDPARSRVWDKIGYAQSKIETLAFKTTLDPYTLQGNLPVNVSLYSRIRLKKVLESMAPAFEAGLCVSDQIALAGEGEQLGDVLIPKGRIGIATVCSAAVSGYLLKNGIPMDARFGGILEMKQGLPVRFVELIYYSGSSLDPSEVFIKGKMTSVRKVSEGRGNILANFREFPSPSLGLVKKLLTNLQKAGIGGVRAIGESAEAICQTPISSNRVGMVLIDGLNPVAYAQEMGIEAEYYAMTTVMDYQSLNTFSEICAGVKRRKLL